MLVFFKENFKIYISSINSCAKGLTCHQISNARFECQGPFTLDGKQPSTRLFRINDDSLIEENETVINFELRTRFIYLCKCLIFSNTYRNILVICIFLVNQK